MLQVIRHKNFLYTTISVGIFVLVWAIAQSIVYLPEPIGSRSAMFAVGIKLTISLSLFSGILGLFLGVVVGVAQLYGNKIVQNTAAFYVWLLTGTPLLTQILFIYYILPLCIPIFKFNEYTSALIALALNVAAYNADVVRSGLMSVPKEQEQSGLSLGFSKLQVLRFIIFPQAMRFSILPLMNNFIVLLKDSSLASAIGLLDLTLVGTRIISETFEPIPVLLTVSGVYLLLTTVCKMGIFLLQKSAFVRW